MLQAINLAASHDGDPLFRDLDLILDSGDRIGLVGPNGVGKSTLLKILAGVLPAERGSVTLAPHTTIGYGAQQVPDPGQPVAAFLAQAPGELAGLAARLDQLADDLTGVEELAAFDAAQERFNLLGGRAYRSRVDAVRARLGVEAIDPARPMGTLSGGEQARVTLARVLLGEPSVLLLDEPTNHLDAAGLDWLGGYLAGYGGALLLVTHDRAVLDRVATRVIELDGIHEQAQFYEGGYTAYRVQKQHRWERLLLDFEAQEKRRTRMEADIARTKEQALSVETTVRRGMGADKLRRYAKKVARKAKARERRLARQMLAAAWIAAPRTRPVLALEFDPMVGDGEPVLTATALSVPGRLAPVDLTIRAGDRVLVSGDNGAGKTTLLRMLAAAPAEVPAAALPQTHDDLRLTVTMLDFFRSRVPMYVEDAEATLSGYLFDEDQRGQPLRTLSAGELRRLLLATIVNSGAQLLLLDEPTNYLDFDSLDVVETALRQFRGTLVMVTHDGYFARAVGVTRHWHVTRGGTGPGTPARVVEGQACGPAENMMGRTSTAL